MHDLDPCVRVVQLHRAIWPERPHDLGLADALALQSMYIFKQPRHRRRGRLPSGRHVPVHRADHRSPGSGSPSRTPRSRTAACGRRRAVTARRCARCSALGRHADDDARHPFEILDDTPLPDPPTTWCRSRSPAGTLVVLHGLLPHWSDANRSPRSRHAYSRALHLGRRRLPRVELAATTGRPAAAPARPSGDVTA